MEVLSNPPLVNSSMQSGGQLGDDKARLEMSPPGSQPVTGPPTPETVSPQHLPEPVPPLTEIPVSNEWPRVGEQAPGQPRHPQSGEFVSPDVAAGPWQPTPSAG